MNEKEIKVILDEIDDLLDRAVKKGEIPSEEILSLLEAISNDLSIIKVKKESRDTNELLQKLDKLIEITSEDSDLSTKTSRSIISAIEKIKIDIPPPQVKVEPPKVQVDVPPIKIPPIKLPEVKVPESKIIFPKEMAFKEPSWLAKIFPIKPILDILTKIKGSIDNFRLPRDPDDPLSVRLSDGEKFYRALGGMGTSGGRLQFKTAQNEGREALVDDDNHLQIDILSANTKISGRPQTFEDTSFVTGDSPATLDVNVALGKNSSDGYIVNDGAGNFTVAISNNGTDFGDEITMKKNEVLYLKDIDVDTIRITWVADSAYRVSVI